ncbi:ABC transporter permease [Inquilinus sp.]|uniref:ABC transporter permease n=1 Tax=Inquilinus sp. TaxID=1932117 RepID=UPI0031D83F1E
MRRNGPLALAFHALFIGFILAPLAMVCLVSFTDKAYLSLPFDGASLRWYLALAKQPDFLRALRLSLMVAATSATLAAALALPAALAIARRDFPGRDAINAVLLSPLLVPHVVLGVAFLRFFTGIGLSGGMPALVLAHTLVILPFALRLTMAACAGLDGRVEQAAASLGARPFTVFRRMTLPLLAAGLSSGWILAFIHSFDELTMTAFIASPSTTTLPVWLYLQIEETITPLVASVSTLLIAGALAAMVVLERLYGLDRILAGGD